MSASNARLQDRAGVEIAASALAARYRSIRSETERLARHLTAEDQVVQSMPDASPTKWHRAHTTWFFETFILQRMPGYREFDSRYGFLFNSYYHSVGPRFARPSRGLLTRPGLDDIRAYREYVDAQMLALLEARGDESDLAALTELGLQHEQQHQELILTDILHVFAQNPSHPAYAPFVSQADAAMGAVNFRALDGGIVPIGHAGEGFSFDNERPFHDVLLQPFAIADQLVTNREWLEFMAAGGYRTAAHWLSDGWTRACEESWIAPLYWTERDGAWHAMTLSGLRPVDLDAPVSHVSYYEADAFARWRGKRLPTEMEWEHAVAALNIRPGDGNFRETEFLRPVPGTGKSAQMFGDVWEWTQSPYTAFPGFQPAEGAVGEYNGKFMVNQLVLRGGSCATNADHIRASYRNFFYPHQRWQFSGLRLAENRPRKFARPAQELPPFLDDVWSGLSHKPKRLPSKYFYDPEGSRLFEAICELPEYYLTRSEGALLRLVAHELAGLVEPETALVEFGCGACTKTRVLLDRLSNIASYIPIDICEESLKRSIEPLVATFTGVDIQPLARDFSEEIDLPEWALQKPRLGFFSGSTIGNFETAESTEFLRRARRSLGPGSRFLVAIDLVKDISTLLFAYDDAQGVTAQFNKNVLTRINRELGGTFDPEGFSHLALWNAERSRIEMHLLSRVEQSVRIAGREFHFAAGETIHTENSHKYTVESFAEIAAEAGWQLLKAWRCPPPEFALVLLG